MSVSAHGELVKILDPILERYENNSRGSEPILVEIIGLGLRVVASEGSIIDNRLIFGLSHDAAYMLQCIYRWCQ